MKNYLLITFFLVICFSSSAQINEVYLDDDLIEITKSEFDRVTNKPTYNLRFDLDTLIVNVKVLGRKKGKISENELKTIRNNLATTTDTDLSKNSVLVINYYPGPDSCNAGPGNHNIWEKNRTYLRRIKKIKNVDQFFIYKFEEGTEKYGKRLNWYPDPNNIFEKTFFGIHYPCASFVLIDENGNYLAVRGEYDSFRIFELLKNKETTFSQI